MDNPLLKSIKSAIKANALIGESFARFGTKQHPRGFVMSAYRNAGRAMTEALRADFPLPGALDVMASMRASLEADIRREFQDMHNAGQEEAARQLGFYGENVVTPSPVGFSSQVDSALAACMSKIDVQTNTMRALVLTGADPSQITGDDSRAGVLRASDILVTTAFFAALMFGTGFDAFTTQQVGQTKYKKQVIAGLDNRTTDCCLKAHGQIQPLSKPFELTGEPRFADKLDWTPFHNYCRSSVALYLADYDLGLTDRMRNAAKTILNERADGIWRDRDPADAFG
jgi:hypothetical protein